MIQFASQNRDSRYSDLASRTPPVKGELRNTFEADLLRQEGWAMRSFICCLGHEIADHRTVGLDDNFGHSNFQIYYPMNAGLALNILYTAVELVKNGQKFKDGDISTDIMHGLTVKFVAATVNGQQMLRMILPDKQGKFEKGEIAPPYSSQYTNLSDEGED